MTTLEKTIINEDTCVFEFQAHKNLRPECEHGLNCPYINKLECENYKRLGNTELRYAYLNLR